MQPTAVLFDAYGTLFDVHSVVQRAEALFPGQGRALSLAWRDRQIEYTRLCSMSGGDGRHYRPFWELTRAGLRHAAKQLQLALTPEGEEALMQQYLRLDPYPENAEVLRELQRRGVPAGILSNGSPEMLQAVVQHAGFAPLLQQVLSVQPVRRFKTDPATYALGPVAFARPAREILFVSSNGWDAIGATWYGYTTLWVNRSGAPLEELDTPPTHTGSSLREVLALLGD